MGLQVPHVSMTEQAHRMAGAKGITLPQAFGALGGKKGPMQPAVGTTPKEYRIKGVLRQPVLS